MLNTEYFQEAEDIFNQAYEKAIHRFSKNHIISLSILEAKATLAVKQKKQVLAKKLRVEILSRTEKLYDEKNIFLARALINLGHSYLVLGNKNIAEQLFKKAEIIFLALGREKTIEFENLLAMQLLCEKNLSAKERLITSIDRRGSPHQKNKVDPTCFQLLTCFPI